MLFMVIETFRDGDARPAYARFREDGRLLPDGLTYVDSWGDAAYSRCFQVMECDDLARPSCRWWQPARGGSPAAW